MASKIFTFVRTVDTTRLNGTENARHAANGTQ